MRLNSSLGLKLIGVAAAALMLAACATTPKSTASAAGAAKKNIAGALDASEAGLTAFSGGEELLLRKPASFFGT